MRGSHRNIALLLVLAATLVAGSAEARVGGNPAAAAAQRISKGAQVRLNRMKQKMALRPRGMMQQKTRRMLRLGKRKMVKAMGRRKSGVSNLQLMRASSRRQIGLGGSESERTRQRFARDVDTGHEHAGVHHTAEPEMFSDFTPEHQERSSGAKQGKKMRDRARRRAEDALARKRRR